MSTVQKKRTYANGKIPRSRRWALKANRYTKLNPPTRAGKRLEITGYGKEFHKSVDWMLYGHYIELGYAGTVNELYRTMKTQEAWKADPPVPGSTVAIPGTSPHGRQYWQAGDFNQDSEAWYKANCVLFALENTGYLFGESWHKERRGTMHFSSKAEVRAHFLRSGSVKIAQPQTHKYELKNGKLVVLGKGHHVFAKGEKVHYKSAKVFKGVVWLQLDGGNWIKANRTTARR